MWKPDKNRLNNAKLVKPKYLKAKLDNVEIINEADEIRDELEELKKLLDQSRVKTKKLNKALKNPYFNTKVEQKLMKFEELIQDSNKSDGDPDRPTFSSQILELKKKNKQLREIYKEIKLNLNQTSELIEIKTIDNLYLKEELGFNKIEHSRLSEDLQNLKQKVNRSKSRALNKKMMKKNRIFALAPAKTSFEKEYSSINSPLFNQSFQIFTQDTKRNPSLELTNPRIGARCVKLR